MQSLRVRSYQGMHVVCMVLIFGMAIGIRLTAADNTSIRLQKAVTVLNELTGPSGHGVGPEEIAGADCIAVIPGFKRGAAVVGVGFGRGFISCRNGDNWSAPGAITFEGGSLGVQIGGETIDVAILSLDKQLRSKLLSDRFTMGSDASAAWGGGKSAHGDPNAKLLFFGHTKGAFAGFELDGTVLKSDESSNKALYGKSIKNSEIVESATTPAAAQPLVSKLTSLIHHEAAASSASRSIQ